MPDKLPPRVKHAETWWVTPPPAPSPRLAAWVRAIDAGWRPNKRVKRMKCSRTAADFFGVYTWEYLAVLAPLLYPGAGVVGFFEKTRQRNERLAGDFLRAIRGEVEVVA